MIPVISLEGFGGNHQARYGPKNGKHDPHSDQAASKVQVFKHFQPLSSSASFSRLDCCGYPQHPDWLHIATAAQRLKVRPGEILGLAVGNEPDWLGKFAGKDGYEAIAVNILAVGKLFQRGPVAGMSVEAFAKSFGLKPRAAMILVRGGHVPSVMERNPKTGQHQPLLTPASITAFQQRFVPLRTLARQLGRSWQTVLRDLEAANVAPFLPEGHDIGSVYE